MISIIKMEGVVCKILFGLVFWFRVCFGFSQWVGKGKMGYRRVMKGTEGYKRVNRKAVFLLILEVYFLSVIVPVKLGIISSHTSGFQVQIPSIMAPR